MPARVASSNGTGSRRLYVGVFAVIAAIAIAGLAWSLRGARSTPAFSTSGEQLLVRQCSSCGKTDEMSMADGLAKGYVDIEGVHLTGDGRRCPACGKETLELAEKCPKDGTIFLRGQIEAGEWKPAVCPKCGWKPPVR